MPNPIDGVEMNMKLLALAVAGAVMLSGLAGCVSKPAGTSGAIVGKPSAFVLSGFDGLKGDVILGNGSYEAVPLFAPIFKNFGNMASLGWKSEKFKGTEVAPEDVSALSSKLAVAYYGQNDEKTTNPKEIKEFHATIQVTVSASGQSSQSSSSQSGDSSTVANGTAGGAIIVSDYKTALQVGPLASLLNAPILYYGATTNEALWRIGAVNPDSIIVAGENVPMGFEKATHLATFDEILNETVSIAKEKGVNLNYITVVNADDSKNMTSYYPDNKAAPHVEYLSCFGSMFAAAHDGIVLTVDATPVSIDKSIQNVSDALKLAGMVPKFLLLIGDSISLPFTYYWIEGYEDLGQIPTDNIYADLEELNPNYNQSESSQGYPEKALTTELANGRLVAKTLGDLSSYFHRITHYKEYLATSTAPAQPMPKFGAEWNNNALAYSSTAAEFGTPEEVEGWTVLFNDGKFNAQEDTAYGHLGVPVGGFPNPSGDLLAQEFARANLIIAGADHGAPHGNSVWYDKLLPMPPNVNFQVSCLTGMIDMHHTDENWNTVTVKDSFVFNMLEKGVACFIAAMRSTLGTIPSSNPALGLCTGSAGDLSYYFMENLIKSNCTVGEALQNAKATLYADPNIPTDEYLTKGNNNRVVVEKFEYELYGDPAFNPYEPCNEGAVGS